MYRRGDKSMVRVYKDLMVTKRELTDLRQSITQTLCGLKQKMIRHPGAIYHKKKICFSCGASHDPAAPHQCRATPKKGANYKQILKETGANEKNRPIK